MNASLFVYYRPAALPCCLARRRSLLLMRASGSQQNSEADSPPLLLSSVPSSPSPALPDRPRVLVISGPTAVGKSSIALQVARRIQGEIISADSVQVYQGLDVGSAKTPMCDRQDVSHHLIDIVHPKEEYSVGEYYRKSRQATKSVLERRNVPILVGGTGMYLRWYLYGPGDVPKSTPKIRALAEEEISRAGGDWDKAVKMLYEHGDIDAGKILRNDWYRLCRRFEILKASELQGSPSDFPFPETTIDSASQLESVFVKNRSKDDLEYDFLCFFLYNSREVLYRFIDQRCEEMLIGDFGLLKEASWLLDLGIMPNSSSASRAIGYRQAMEYLLDCRKEDGVSSHEQFFSFLREFQRASRNFAKRQLTWFRQEPLFQWVDASRNQDLVVDFIVKAYSEPAIISTEAANGIILKESKSFENKNRLKVYTPINRYFCRPEDCFAVLEWIRKTQRGKSQNVQF